MRASAPRAFLPAIVVLGLVAVVAIAATGSTRGGSDDTRRPSDIAPRHVLHVRAPGADSGRGALDLRAHATKGDRRGGRFGQVPTEQRAPVVLIMRAALAVARLLQTPAHSARELRGERSDLAARAGATEARATRYGGSVRARARLDPDSGGVGAHRGRGRRVRRRARRRAQALDPGRAGWPRRPPTCWTSRSTTCAPSRTLAAP